MADISAGEVSVSHPFSGQQTILVRCCKKDGATDPVSKAIRPIPGQTRKILAPRCFPAYAWKQTSTRGLRCPSCGQRRKSRIFCEPHVGTGALSSFSSLRLPRLSGASRDSGHSVRPRASPSSRPIPRVWSLGCAQHIPGRRPVRHAAGPCRDRAARFRTPSHAHQPTSIAFRRKPIAGREFPPWTLTISAASPCP